MNPAAVSKKPDPRRFGGSPPSRRHLRQADWFFGGFALAAIALHDTSHVREGRWYDAFWVCNLAALLVGPAVLLRSALLATVALTWILPGTIVWLASALAGANLLPSSYGVHFGGSAIAAWAVWRSGYAPKSLLPALALPAASVLVSRLFLPATSNVNAAYFVPRGFAALGGHFLLFAVTASVLVIAVGAFGQVVCRWISKV